MARSRSINVILNLRDRFTQPIQRSATEARRFEREVKRVENNIKKHTSNMTKNFKKMVSNIMNAVGSFTLKGIEKAFTGLKVTATASLAAVGASLTAGLSEGLDYEKYRVQLQTATKDTEKTTKLMKNAIDYANKTPFETGEIIEATSKFEAMGLSAEKWLGITADMAGATSKDMIQAVEAIIDAVASGEFERLKEFGIKKASLDGFNASGSLVDQNAMVDSLMKQMQDRFEGGAEELSKTTSGMWSTVTGTFKNSMAKVIGVLDDGTIRSGSILSRLRDIIQKVADKFTEWQNNGTIDKIAEQLDKLIMASIQGFKDLIAKIKEVIAEVKAFLASAKFEKFINTIKVIAPLIMGIVAAQKLWTAGIKLYEMWILRAEIAQAAMNVVTGIWNALALANPWGLLLTAIIAILLLVVFNFDKVKAVCIDLWNKWLVVWESIKTKTSEVVTSMATAFGNFWTGLKNGVKGFANFFVEKINWCIEKLNGLLSFKMPDFLGGAEVGVNIPTIPEFATGTSYHRGGLARINEGGRGEILNLPNGTQVIPHDVSKKAASQNTSVTVPITIQGNVYGDADLVNRVGSLIAQRVTLAIGNV